MKSKILVTRPSLPDLSKLVPALESIWESGQLTNQGPLHEQLEEKLATYLKVPYLALFNNGTIALMAALKALNLSGEVITTPFTFAATAHAIVWCGLTPVFVDIEQGTANISPSEIRAALSHRTSAIVPVHCYGVPCAHAEIEAIAREQQLKVVYDSAHAFGVENNNGSILKLGDLSVLSFHATKVFSTVEGGAIVCHSKDMKDRLARIRNFGIASEEDVSEIGLNGKLNEIASAMGLAQLEHIDGWLNKRRELASQYAKELGHTSGIKRLPRNNILTDNHAYYPILIDRHMADRDSIYAKLKQENIYARRYFYPLLTDTTAYKNAEIRSVSGLANAKRLAETVLCLPIHPGLSPSDIHRICSVLKRTLLEPR